MTQTNQEASYEEQLRLACDGDSRSLEWIMENERPWLMSLGSRFASWVGGMEPEDLLQHLWMAFFTRPGPKTFDSRADLRAWLKTSMFNKAVSMGRKYRTPLFDQGQEPNLAAAPQASAEEYAAPALHQSRSRLTFRQEAAVVLRDYCGCTRETIAMLLDCPSVNAASNLRFRALQQMRNDLQGLE